jgi:osomolarity two-component system sensor histidine kinase TcsA
MMTSDEAQPNSTKPGRSVRSIDEAFEAFTPIPSVLLDSALCIIRVSASYLAFNHLTSHECVGLNIYDLVAAKTLSPGPAALQVVLDNAIATKNVYATGEHAAPGLFCTTLRAVPIFEQDTLLYVLLEVPGTTVEHERQEAINDQLDTNDTYRVVS